MVESRGPTEVEGGGEKVGGQQIWGSSRSLLELIFWPSLPKSEVEGQVGVLLEMLLAGQGGRRVRVESCPRSCNTVAPHPWISLETSGSRCCFKDLAGVKKRSAGFAGVRNARQP
jgi:hypothetical protein